MNYSVANIYPKNVHALKNCEVIRQKVDNMDEKCLDIDEQNLSEIENKIEKDDDLFDISNEFDESRHG